MNRSQLSAPADIARFHADGRIEHLADSLSPEQPLEIRIQGRSLAITMRTPGHDPELAAGLALSEGLIQSPDQLIDASHCRRQEAQNPENILNLFLRPSAKLDPKKLSRRLLASSSCGICGKTSLEAIQNAWPPVQSNFTIPPERLLSLPKRLRQTQWTFQQTGGLHAAALFDQYGSLLCLREDVGRHNAVDKAIGHCLFNGPFPLHDRLLLISGRASFEIMQKALAARIPFVAAISAPSSLAVECAQANRQTLVGFLRPPSFNCYASPERLAQKD
ncbi:MAG: Sulfurtransferase FdhD [Verrucomicrobia subdivision 3 bacterium]|nr:Sulfurtransferase FdhD [Limisphaerales bacterium]MCS1417882.1 Sulfurtransferase FdhD [Limisphaerales bacterium]UWK15761.1 LasU [uncultured Verrucomicrobiota bacterium]UWK15782.1 LasU [uncultured Verrucomicrobiota bacterium]